MERRLISIPRFGLLPLCSLLLAACGRAAAPTAAIEPTSTPAAAVTPANQDSWILVDLPPDATQLQHGAEIYRLVCSACHAHSGEGLTDAWRATWNPKDQNCWQSKCHAANHPPDGFELPIAPAVVGRAALAPFQTAADLRNYIQATMPWQDPNSLTEDEGWAVTAYVIKLNRMNPEPELNAGNATQFRLHPESAQPTPTMPPETQTEMPRALMDGPAAIVAAAALVGIAVFLAIRAARQGRRSGER